MSNIYGIYGGAFGSFNYNDIYVTLDTTQTITGEKTFNAATILGDRLSVTGTTTLNNILLLNGGDNSLRQIYNTYYNLMDTSESPAGGLNVGRLFSFTLNSFLEFQSLNHTWGVVMGAATTPYTALSVNATAIVSSGQYVRFNSGAGERYFNFLPYSSSPGQYNNSTQTGDSVLCAGSVAAVLNLCSQGNVCSGLRIEQSQVTLGAGGSSSVPSSYLQINNGANAICVGPAISTSDSSTKIATTAWVQSAISSFVVGSIVTTIYTNFSGVVIISATSKRIDLMVVGGGGGGGWGNNSSTYGGGGAAGGAAIYTFYTSRQANLYIMCGAGGFRAIQPGAFGSNGSNSEWSLSSDNSSPNSLVLVGGGQGGFSSSSIASSGGFAADPFDGYFLQTYAGATNTNQNGGFNPLSYEYGRGGNGSTSTGTPENGKPGCVIITQYN